MSQPQKNASCQVSSVQPLFNSEPGVSRAGSTADTACFSSASISQPRPLFGAPPAGFPLLTRPPTEGALAACPPQPSDASHSGPTNDEEDPANLQPDMELDSDDEHATETSEEDPNSGLSSSAKDDSIPPWELNRNRDYERAGHEPEASWRVGLKRLDMSQPWSGGSGVTRSSLVSERDGLDACGREREVSERSIERSGSRGMGSGAEATSLKLQVEQSHSSPGVRTSRPGVMTWTSTAASRPPAFAAGAVEEGGGEEGKKEEEMSQHDQADDAGDLGQGKALESIRESYLNHPEEQLPGHSEERLPGHPEERLPGHHEERLPGHSGERLPRHPEERLPGYHEERLSGRRNEDYSGRPGHPNDRWYPPERYVDRLLSSRQYPDNAAEDRYGGSAVDHYGDPGEDHHGDPGEDHYGNPDEEQYGEQYSGHPDEYYSGHPNERHPDEAFSGQPGENFPNHPDERYSNEHYSRRADYYSDHPRDDYFPPGHPDERFSDHFDDYSGHPDRPYHDRFEYPEHPDRRFYPDDRCYRDEHYLGHPDEHERYPGRPNPYRDDGGPHYHDCGPRGGSDGPHGYGGMDSQHEDWREERNFHPRDRAYLLGKCWSVSTSHRGGGGGGGGEDRKKQHGAVYHRCWHTYVLTYVSD